MVVLPQRNDSKAKPFPAVGGQSPDDDRHAAVAGARSAGPVVVMRRLELRRLEAALSRLSPTMPIVIGEAATIEDLIRELEAAAEETTPRHEHDDQLTNRVTNRLRAALDALAVGVVICDEGGEEIYRNLSAGGLGSARPSDVLADQAVKEVLACARKGEDAERALELFSPYRRNLMIRATPIAAIEGHLGAVAVIEDVSERRRLDAIRRDFVANVSHELKTPVGALSLLAETLDGEEDPVTVARLATRVGMEAERLGRIIDDLLDLSRIEANEGQRVVPVDLERVVEDAIEPLRATADAKGISLDIEMAGATCLTVPGDRLDLISAVSNLVDNAVKYSEHDSSVRVSCIERGGLVSIAVTDSGIGIPARDLERIFERFYRVDRARSRLTGGTGLGLSIVRHVAANHGGRIEVSSREGEGSTFTLVLPTGPHSVIGLVGKDGVPAEASSSSWSEVVVTLPPPADPTTTPEAGIA
jgi:two-component system sensor histidine kinase SenX3